MDNPDCSTYDAVPYPTCAYPQTHPDRLAAQAALFGLETTAPERCRVLELGCGDGTNLLSVAADLPEARVVGIDLAANPVSIGQERARRYGLPNLTLRRMDVGDPAAAAAELGEFDYVIAHGVYSWVNAAARDGLLALCRACLAPRGVAYVSYNVLPGGYFRKMAREMMFYHLGRAGPAGWAPAQRLRAARGLIQFVAEAQSSFRPDGAGVTATAGAPPARAAPQLDDDNDYALVLRRYHERIQSKKDAALYHDELSDDYEVLYFHQFVAHAARHGLAYLTEAEFFETRNFGLTQRLRETLDRLAGDDVLALEQYTDFVRGRAFRQTLLCRADGDVIPLPRPDMRRVRGLYFASPADIVADSGSGGSGATRFRGVRGTTITASDPLGKATYRALGAAWPRPLQFGEVLAAVRDRLARGDTTRQAGLTDEDFADAVARTLLGGAGAAVVCLWARRPVVAAAPSARPVARPLVRQLAADGTQVVNALGEPANIEPAVIRRLLVLLDGSRDRAALARELAPMFPGGGGGGAGGSGGPTPAWLEDALNRLARLALLTA